MKAALLPVHVGPGVDSGRLDRMLADLGLEPVELSRAVAPDSPALYLVAAASLKSPEQLRTLSRGGAVVVLHEDAEVPPAGWDGDAVWVPAAAPARVLAAALRIARDNLVLKARVSRLEAAELVNRERFQEMNRIGIALSAEADFDSLQDLILQSCRQLTRADAATLYLVEEDDDGQRVLRFAWTQTDSVAIPFASFHMPLAEESIAGHTVISGTAIKLADVYELPPNVPYGFNRSFDEEHGYRSKSMLCVPMRNHDGGIVGAIQLINAKRSFEARLEPGNVEAEVVPFEDEHLDLIQSIASQAAVALDNKMLLDSIQNLFEGFVEASVTAIESRDPTTYGHSGRVAALTVALAEAASETAAGAYKDLHFTPDQLKEIRYASLLHDFGKVGVREHVLVKEKKLYPANIDHLRSRFAFVERSVQQKYTELKLQAAIEHGGVLEPGVVAELDNRQAREIVRLREWLEAVLSANEPTVLPEDKASTLSFLAEYMYEDVERRTHPLLEPDEYHFLSIRKGTLDEVERLEIESHVSWSYRFLTKIPWTPAMRSIPQIAYAHHEKLDGSGYPRRLRAAEIPVQARMMTISDIFDALTAQDRPYKRAVSTEAALDILAEEAGAGKLDEALLELFIARKVYDEVRGHRPDQDLFLAGVPRPHSSRRPAG
ncbi:MAG: GAF domain-containing protein [Chloroflexi bacterium]|nr:MAG: GAF domain-containing protein [Chloroflexota bacterium]